MNSTLTVPIFGFTYILTLAVAFVLTGSFDDGDDYDDYDDDAAKSK